MVFRIGLVGAGRMGLTHLDALRGERGISITAIAEPRSDVAKRLTAEGYVVSASVDGLIGSSDVDGFLVSTPSGSHRGVVEQLSATGKPILCEKPAGLSVRDAEHMKMVCATSGSRLQIGYWRRFIPSLRRVRSRIHSGEFGRVLMVAASQWDNEPPNAQFRNTSGGIATDMGVHELDVIRWITGQEISHAHQSNLMSRDNGVTDEDAAVIHLELADGTLGVATLGRFFPRNDWVGFEVMGDRDHARIDVLSARTGTRPQLDALRRQARAFARGGDPHAATIDDAIAVLRVLELKRKVAR